MFTTKLKQFDAFVIKAKTSTSATSFVTGIVSMVLPKPIAVACGLMCSNKVIYYSVLQKYFEQRMFFRENTTNYYFCW